MNIIEKYEKILQKPHADPYKNYLTELVEALKEKGEKPKASKKVSGPPDFKGDIYTPQNTDA